MFPLNAVCGFLRLFGMTKSLLFNLFCNLNHSSIARNSDILWILHPKRVFYLLIIIHYNYFENHCVDGGAYDLFYYDSELALRYDHGCTSALNMRIGVKGYETRPRSDILAYNFICMLKV